MPYSIEQINLDPPKSYLQKQAIEKLADIVLAINNSNSGSTIPYKVVPQSLIINLVANTPILLLGVRENRTGFVIYNESLSTVYIGYDFQPNTAAYSVAIPSKYGGIEKNNINRAVYGYCVNTVNVRVIDFYGVI